MKATNIVIIIINIIRIIIIIAWLVR